MFYHEAFFFLWLFYFNTKWEQKNKKFRHNQTVTAEITAFRADVAPNSFPIFVIRE